jgi:hypothetical protein
MALIKTAKRMLRRSSSRPAGKAGSRTQTERLSTKTWFEPLKTLLVTVMAAVPGTFLGLMNLANQKETQQSEQLQTIIESAVSKDAAKERAAIHFVSSLATSNQRLAPFALSILGTVARNGDDEQLRSDVYDAIEDLTDKSAFDLAKFDSYDQLELFCLEAALTPAQYWRQRVLHKIELGSTDQKLTREATERLTHEAASKLLSLSQLLSDSHPQTAIDLLMSVLVYYSDPDIIDRATPALCRAVKTRDVSGNESNKDVADCLALAAAARASIAEANAQVGTAAAGYRVRQASRSAIRLYLARALVAKDQSFRDDSLAKFAQIIAARDLNDDAQMALDGLSRMIKDPDLQGIVTKAANDLQKAKPGARLTSQTPAAEGNT